MQLHLTKSDRVKSSVLLVFAAAIVSGCAPQIAVVSEKPPARFQAASGTNPVTAKTIDRAQGLQRTQPLVALEAYVSAARESLHELDRNPANTEARRCYNFAVAGIFSVIRQAKLDPWTQPVHFGANSELTLSGKKDPAKPEQNPALYELVPTDALSYHGAYVKHDVKKDGIGAPLVAVRHLTADQAAALFAPPAIYYGVTGFAEFEGSRVIRCRRILQRPWRWDWPRRSRKNLGSCDSCVRRSTPQLSGSPDCNLTIPTKPSCWSYMD
jgi:hypothetical protein